MYTGTDLVIDLNTVAKDERVRDLHHGGLQVQGHHEAPGLAVSNLLLKELNQVPPIESACYTYSIHPVTEYKSKNKEYRHCKKRK